MAVGLKRVNGIARAVAAAVVAALAAPGCDDGDVARRTAPAPATQRAVVASNAQPATSGKADPAQTQPANAFLTIDGVMTEFPPARMRITRTDEGVRALLFSDDPRSATNAEYKGNSFYFDVPLKASDPKDIQGAEYWYKAPASDAEEDLPYGIFLGGIRGTHLQPQDLAFKFDADGEHGMVRVAGRFLVVHQTGKATQERFAGVVGTLFTTVETKD